MMKVSKLKALGAAILSFVVFCSTMPVAGFAAGEEVVVPNNDNSKMILHAHSGKGTIAKDVNFYKSSNGIDSETPDGPKENLGEQIVMERKYRITADPGYTIKRVDVDGKTEYTEDGSYKKHYDFEDKVTGRLTHENTLDISYPDHTFDVWFEEVHVTIPNSGPGPDAPEPEQKGDYHLDFVAETDGCDIDLLLLPAEQHLTLGKSKTLSNQLDFSPTGLRIKAAKGYAIEKNTSK